MPAPKVDGRTVRYQHRRPELLAAASEYVLQHGIAGLSLRPAARALGVTHATLLRHFSTKDELLAEVVEHVRARFVAQLAADEARHADADTAELVRAAWQRLCEPAEQRQFLLLFQLVGPADPAAAVAPDVARALAEDWRRPIERRLVRDGHDPDDAVALSTAVVATVRGLQLDLVLSGDRERADRALETVLRTL